MNFENSEHNGTKTTGGAETGLVQGGRTQTRLKATASRERVRGTDRVGAHVKRWTALRLRGLIDQNRGSIVLLCCIIPHTSCRERYMWRMSCSMLTTDLMSNADNRRDRRCNTGSVSNTMTRKRGYLYSKTSALCSNTECQRQRCMPFVPKI